MKILITGGSGFVGKNVKEYLERRTGYEIDAPGSDVLNCIDEDAVKSYLGMGKYDVVLHFAVYGDGIDKTKDGKKSLEYNLRMFENFSRCYQMYGRMIYTGSGAEYDKRYPIVSVTEENIHDHSLPVDPYGLMKYLINREIEGSENIYNLRLFGIYGKYEYWKTKFISNLCCKSIKGLPLSIRQNCYFDYIWIDDFCRMLELFLKVEKPLYHVYNAVRGEKIDLLSLAHIVNQVSHKSNPVVVCREGWANEYTADNHRILYELPNMSFTAIYDAVNELYQWYQENEKNIDTYSLIYG